MGSRSWRGAACALPLACPAGTTWAGGTRGLCVGSDAHLRSHRKSSKGNSSRESVEIQIKRETKGFLDFFSVLT